MTAEEALSRLAYACGDYPSDNTPACAEISALKQSGWTASMILNDGGITIVLKGSVAPPKVLG